MKYKNLFFLFIICAPFISCFNLNLMNLVTSFVLFEEKPTSVLIPKLCWTPFETMLLTKKLINENIFLAPSLQANRSEYFLQQILILADLSCPGVEEFLIQTSDKEYFKSPYRWLLLDPEIGSYKFDLLNKLDMPLNSDVVIAKKVNNDEYHLIEAYKISENSDVIYTTRGVWRSSSDEIKNPKYNSVIEIAENSTFDVMTGGNEERNRIEITKYGTIEDYRETKVISIRRQNLRRHVLTMANVITDSNETRKHLDDRLFVPDI